MEIIVAAFDAINAIMSMGPAAGDHNVVYAFWNFLAMAAPFVGKMFSAGGNQAAKNRGTALDASLTRDQIATQRGQLDINQQAENRTERDDAWKQLQRIAYARSRQQPMQAPGYLPSEYYRSGYRTTSPEELQGAEGMERELMARLQGGPRQLNLPALTDVERMSKRSAFEKIADFLGPGLNLLGGMAGGGNNRGYNSSGVVESD